MKTFSGKNSNLSRINTISDLDAEIAKVKQRVRQSGADMKSNFKRIPTEAVRSTLGAALPFFRKTKSADKASLVLQALAGGIIASIIDAKKGKKTFRQGMADTVRQIGFWSMASAVVYLLRKRKKKS